MHATMTVEEDTVNNPTAAAAATSNMETSSQKSGISMTSKATSISVACKDDLWKDADFAQLPEAPGVMVQWFEIHKHVVFGRAVLQDASITNANDADTVVQEHATVANVLDLVVDQMWKRTAKDILEKGIHVSQDSYPPAAQLLALGAVWLLNEQLYVQGHGSHAHRVSPKDAATTVPDWKVYTLRIHTCPERHFCADSVDWGKCCRGLLLNSEVTVSIDDSKPCVPVTALPDEKDGAIVYEVCCCCRREYFGFEFCLIEKDAHTTSCTIIIQNDELGFAVLNKPGSVPLHPSVSNHTEDLVSKFTMALHDNKKKLQTPIRHSK